MVAPRPQLPLSEDEFYWRAPNLAQTVEMELGKSCTQLVTGQSVSKCPSNVRIISRISRVSQRIEMFHARRLKDNSVCSTRHFMDEFHLHFNIVHMYCIVLYCIVYYPKLGQNKLCYCVCILAFFRQEWLEIWGEFVWLILILRY